MNLENSIFKFVTIRNASSEVKNDSKFMIQPKTSFIKSLVSILANDQKQSNKMKAMNEHLNVFIKSEDFYKTKSELTDINKRLQASETKKILESKTELKTLYENLYNNIVARTITKSNTSEVFKLLIDTIKLAYQNLNLEKVTIQDLTTVQIVLPEGLILSFSPEREESTPDKDERLNETVQIISKINDLIKQKSQIDVVKDENAKQINLEQKKILKQQNEISKNQLDSIDNIPTKSQRQNTAKTRPAVSEISTLKRDSLLTVESTLNKTGIELETKLADLNMKLFQLLPQVEFAYIGEKYVDLTRFEPKPPIIENDAILVYSRGCYLKFPFQIADLRVVEQKTVGYLPNEIAHINNTQPGEKQEKVTRRLRRVETFDSLITEDEITKETDTQSTEKNSLEKAASEVQAEETSINANTSVSGTYGVTTASLDAGFSHSEAETNSNNSSETYAKEIVQRVVEKVTQKVKSERSLKTIEEFEETVTHIIDNTGGTDGTGDKGPKSYVYRWLTKLVKATLKNYGKRLMFQIDIAHPSNYYVSRILKEGIKINIPPDPRILRKNSTDQNIKKFYADHPSFPYSFEVENITRLNYLAWAELYNAKLDQPKEELIHIGSSFFLAPTAGSYNDIQTDLKVDDGYKPKYGFLNVCFSKGDMGVNTNYMQGHFGNNFFHLTEGTGGLPFGPLMFQFNGSEITVPLSFRGKFNEYTMNVEIVCELKAETFKAWQIKCYHAIIEAYDKLKSEAESKMSEFNPNNTGINPTRKNELIKTELKKGALLKLFRCNPFWINDKYEVGKEYDPDCCKDNLNAEKVRFLETVFDWKNFTYELYPYFYANHDKLNSASDNWSKLLNLSDSDPHFESFLQASYATLRIPVNRDSQKEIAAINFILNNSIANYAAVPAGIQSILDDLNENTPFGFINETPTTIPFIEIIKDYDRTGQLKIYYIDSTGNEVICSEVLEFDKEGNKTKFYYNGSGQVVISEIKDGFNDEGQKYNYYFNSSNEKIIIHKTMTQFDIDGSSKPYYSIGLGIFNIPTDLVILEKGVQNGVELIGYEEDSSDPTSDVIIPKQYSPAIIKK